MRHARTIVAALALAAISVAVVPSSAAAARCADVVNPYAGTRYEGIDLTRIRTDGVSCDKARQVARRGHRRALAAVPNTNGIVRERWHGWRVKGDLKPNSDRYVARKDGRRVRWRF